MNSILVSLPVNVTDLFSSNVPKPVMRRHRRRRCEKKDDSAYQSNHGEMIMRLAAQAKGRAVSASRACPCPRWSRCLAGHHVVEFLVRPFGQVMTTRSTRSRLPTRR